MAEEYFHINKKIKVDFDEDENTDDSDNDTDCLVSDSDRDSDTIEEDKIILKNRTVYHHIRRTTADIIQKKFEDEIGGWKKITRDNSLATQYIMDLCKDTRVDTTYDVFKDDPVDDVHPTDILLSHVDYQEPSTLYASSDRDYQQPATLFASRVSDRAEAVSPPGPREYRIVSMLGNPNPGHVENEARARQKRKKMTEEQRQRQKARARQRRKEIRLNFGALQDAIGDVPTIKGKITRVVILKEATERIIRMRNGFF
ncbi:UNVERIFIED_CONTAM: hypothetical protein FKN15_016171 [Acipenser sinensis]